MCYYFFNGTHQLSKVNMKSTCDKLCTFSPLPAKKKKKIKNDQTKQKTKKRKRKRERNNKNGWWFIVVNITFTG